MEVHLRGDEATGKHTRFTVFMNGANCGQLCMSEEEAFFFHDTILRTPYRLSEDLLRSTGEWFKKVDEKDEDDLEDIAA